MALYLSESEVAELLSPREALDAIEACFIRLARGVVENRPRTRISARGRRLRRHGGGRPRARARGVKSYAWLPGGTPFVVVLFDLAGAELAAVIEADKLGQLRTGAASGVAAKFLAKPDARTLGVIGCGWQAETQVACIREAVPAIERVVAYCRTRGAARGVLRASRRRGRPRSHRDAGEQDVVVTVTTSTRPCAARRVAAARRARLRGRRERPERARARQRRARARRRSSAATRSSRRSSSQAT